MQRVLIVGLAAAVGASGCTSQSEREAQKQFEEQKIAVSQQLLHVWVDCARKSYQNFEGTMLDKNEAAERALAACQSEEMDFRQTSPEILFPHLRESVKEILVKHEAW